MKIRIADAKGEIPAKHPRLVPMTYATKALNTRLDDGTIAPVRQTELVETLGADADTIFFHKDDWYSFEGEVDVVPGPVRTDRLYVTGDGTPKMYANDTVYELALPAPAAAPSVDMSGSPDDDIAQFVSYAYTFVTIFDEESAPSPLSEALLWSTGNDVTVAGFSAPVANRGVDRIRIYRSITSGLGITDLFFVKELPIATTSYVHDAAVDPLQEILPSADYDEPPATMTGLIAMPNGMMAAFDGKEILFSEPFRPHAWPEKYRLTVDVDVVGLASFATTLAIMTRATPYIAQGTAPENMVMEKMERDLPCVSKRGIVDFGYSAAYPSNEGLVVISGGGAELITRGLFTSEQWRKLDPTSFHAERYEDRYFFAHLPLGASAPSLGIIDMTGMQPYLIESDLSPRTMTRDPETGALFMLIGNREIYQWDAPEAELKRQEWRSRLFQLVSPSSYAGVLIETDPPKGTIPAGQPAHLTRVYADGQLVREFSAVNEPARLPGGFRSKSWEIEILGYVPVTGISMAQSYDELSVP